MGDCQSREKQGDNGEASLWPSLWFTRSREQSQMKSEENPELRSLQVPSESDKLYREALLQLQRTTSAQSPPSESLFAKLERQFSTPPTSGNASPCSTTSAPSMFLPLLPSSPLQGKGDDQAPQYSSVLDPPTQNKIV